MIINVKNSKGLSLSRKQNIAFGIQKWLLSKGFCKGKVEHQVASVDYEFLLKGFCKEQKGFDESRVKGFETYENFVNNRFQDFTQYCINKFKVC